MPKPQRANGENYIMQPLVSVVIATHNRPALLIGAVLSVLDQTYPNVEIIVVDDYGNANTDTLKTLGVNYINIPLTHWVSENRNAGIRAAKGKYVAILDDDDYWFDYYLDTLIPVMEADPSIGFACANGYQINTFGEEPTRQLFPQFREEMKGNLFIKMIWSCFTLPSLMIVRKDLLDKVDLYQNISGEDLELIMRLASITNIYYSPKECGVWYRRIDASSASVVSQSTLKEQLRLLPFQIKCLNDMVAFGARHGRHFSFIERTFIFLQTYFFECYVVAIHFLHNSPKRYKMLREACVEYPYLMPITLLTPLCKYSSVRKAGNRLKRLS